MLTTKTLNYFLLKWLYGKFCQDYELRKQLKLYRLFIKFDRNLTWHTDVKKQLHVPYCVFSITKLHEHILQNSS